MAKFLQETMGELSLDLKNAHAVNADEFNQFMLKVPTTIILLWGILTALQVRHGDKVTNKEILKFSKLFEDEVTLEKVSREV